ncbi:MAG: amidase [Gammaproteobacteria bacterium]|nr:amidase [Gammaproteobacteria bacterium]
MSDIYQLSASEALRAMAASEFTAEEYATACLARIDAVEETVGAWEFLDRDYLMEQARDADRYRQTGRALGALHGIPVGVKDIIDTQDMPTQLGTPLHANRTPGHDAHLISRLREAGAVIAGKTVTTELAVYAPGKTTNPHNAEHTPGGSSSGSAAAVAAGMVPLALGTQTNGSVIRPASYCGVYGFKPTFGAISRHGVLQVAPSLDQVGVFSRDLEDIALFTEVLAGYDVQDTSTRARARPAFRAGLNEPLPLPPRLAMVRTPVWDQADADTREAFSELFDHFGERIHEVELPESFAAAHAALQVIMESELALNFAREYTHGAEQLSDTLRGMIEAGQRHTAVEYQRARGTITELNRQLDVVLYDYDALVTPATTGEAPHGLTSTGSPVFCTIWSLLGVPALSLPLLRGSHDLPMGVQLVGARDDDVRLLRVARWINQEVNGDGKSVTTAAA